MNRAAPTFTLNRSSIRSSWPKVNCELPPPVSKTTSEPVVWPRAALTARKASRASSSPGITSISTPVRSRTASISSELFEAVRMPAVPTAAIPSTPFCCASSTIPAIASAVRRIGSGSRRPLSSSPSPSRVTSARSTTVRHEPSAARSPMWNFTEFVPTSITA